MCGIAGILGLPQEPAMGALAKMIDAMKHRGPDGHGAVFFPLDPANPRGQGLALGHCRLAILDLTPAGSQPMISVDQRFAISFNGEVYNFRELLVSLTSSGFHPRSSSDTEVLLEHLSHHGLDGLSQVRGMFAFALWDLKRPRLILARDRLGIKPLYFAHLAKEGVFVFASEMRAILASGLVNRRLSVDGIDSYLAHGAVLEPLTTVQDVNLLRSGHMMIVDGSTLKADTESFWRWPEQAGGQRSINECVESLKPLLMTAIDEHLQSDVPIGVFLSGGMDSSALVALAAGLPNKDSLTTVSVGFDNEAYDESSFAEAVADKFNTNHVLIKMGAAETVALLPQAIEALDQPTLDGTNVYVVSQAARLAGLTVALSGMGGDEVFCGYGTFGRFQRILAWHQLYKRVPRIIQILLESSLSAFPRSGHRRLNKLQAEVSQIGDLVELYILRHLRFSDQERTDLMGRTAADNLHGVPSAVRKDWKEEASGQGIIGATAYMHSKLTMLNMFLRDSDSMSMAHSLELRVPFLDHRLVEAVSMLPDSVRYDPMVPKVLLQRIAGDKLPIQCVDRRKMGFTFPFRAWFHEGKLGDSVTEFAERPTGVVLDPFATKRLGKLCVSEKRGYSWHSFWLLYVLEQFARNNRLSW